MAYHSLTNFAAKTAFLSIALLTLASCATSQDPNNSFGSPSSSRPMAEDVSLQGLTTTQIRLVEAAHWAVGRTDVSCDGREFALDCSGLILSMYWKAGIDLSKAYPLYEGNGVRRLYLYLADRNLLYRPDEPMTGDLIFWDQSYDKNGNGKADDELTHIGMVVSTDDQGTVTYVHHDYLSGVIFAKMNPANPSDRTVNNGMRMMSLGPTPEGHTTAGELYRMAGQAWRLPVDR